MSASFPYYLASSSCYHGIVEVGRMRNLFFLRMIQIMAFPTSIGERGFRFSAISE